VSAARTASFPEIIEATGGGSLRQDQRDGPLANAWESLLAEPARLAKLACEAGPR